MQKIQYKIYGGEKIIGTVLCSGAKNLATKILVASILSKKKIIVNNIPKIKEINTTIELLLQIGSLVLVKKERILLHTKEISKTRILNGKKYINRISILLLSVLLNRKKGGYIPKVVGDKIGARKINYHIYAICKYGGEFYETQSEYIAYRKNKLFNAKISLPYPSVGATENCIFLSILTEGISIIKNIAIEPEIIELILMLKSMGAIILFNKSREIIINGVKSIGETKFRILEDRVETISWATISYISKGEIQIININKSIIKNFLEYIKKIGCRIYFCNQSLICLYEKEKPIQIETNIYPSFSTDFQQIACIILTKLKGISVIHETVYEKRFKYINILKKFGVKIKISKFCIGTIRCKYKKKELHSIIIYGGRELYQRKVFINANDLRGGFSYLVKSILTKEESRIRKAEEIERGYGNLISKLINTSIKIKRINIKNVY